jgi:hypothetical protein
MTHGISDPGKVLPPKKQPRPLTLPDAASYAFRETSKSEKVPLVSMWPGRLIVNPDSTVSGRRYVFDQAGAIIDVDPVDVEVMLALQRGPTGCCGSSGEGERHYLAKA